MRRIILAAALAISLSGCAGLGGVRSIPTAPSQVAEHTVADEQARLRCEQAYKLSRSIGEIGVDAGLVRGPLATQLASLDNRLYAALQACRTAYRAFNSNGLISAADELDRLADQVQALVRGERR